MAVLVFVNQEFVNQAITMGKSAPTNTASSERMTLDKTDGKWLVYQFDPV